MPEYPYYPTYPKDLNGDHKVILMDNRTYGVYRRLLDIAWHEEPAATLPTDDRILAVYAKETLEGWREVAPLVLSCFQKRNGRYWQKRLRSEWEKLASVRAKQSEAGRRRWSNEVSCSSPISSPHAHASGSGSGSGSENPVSPVSGNGHPPAIAPPDEFAEFWSLYPRRVAKQDALAAWRKRKPPLAAVKIALAWQRESPDWTKEGGKYIPYPATWLNRGSWEDEPPDKLENDPGRVF